MMGRDDGHVVDGNSGRVQKRIDANHRLIAGDSTTDVEDRARHGRALDALHQTDFVVEEGVTVNRDARRASASHAGELGRALRG